MEKSLKSKIVSIISAVVLAFCSLLAFVVPSLTEQPQTASASVMGNNSLYYYGTGCWVPFGLSISQAITPEFYCVDPYISSVAPSYHKVSGAGGESSFLTHYANNVNSSALPVAGKYNYKGRCYVLNYTGQNDNIAAAWNYRAPLPAYVHFQYIDNSPLVMYTSSQFTLANRFNVPMSMLYQGIYINSQSLTTLNLIYDIYFQAKSSSVGGGYGQVSRRFDIPVSSLRNSVTHNTFITFADLWRIGMGVDANFSDYIGEDAKYVYSRVSVGGSHAAGIGFGICSNDTVVYDGTLNITTVENPNFHYGHIFVDAVNEFTDIEIGKGLSIKFILLIVLGLTLAVSLIKMLI